MQLIKIISEHKKIKSFKMVFDEGNNYVKVPVRKPRLGFKRIEGVFRDNWGQLWTRHVDIKNNN